jgi:biopolymer transport protein TolR
MGAPSHNDSGTISEINITPFVDVVLVLLIIFLVTAKLVFAPAKAIPVNLPQASKAESLQPVLAITLLANGDAQVDGKPVDDGALVEAAREELARHPGLRAVIQADGDVPHRRVVHVMDLLSRAKLTQIAFAVRVEEPAP